MLRMGDLSFLFRPVFVPACAPSGAGWQSRPRRPAAECRRPGAGIWESACWTFEEALHIPYQHIYRRMKGGQSTFLVVRALVGALSEFW